MPQTICRKGTFFLVRPRPSTGVLCKSNANPDIVAADFGNNLAYASQLAIFASIIYEIYHPDRVAVRFTLQDSVGDVMSPCKSPDVHGKLAILNGWKNTFDQITGTIFGSALQICSGSNRSETHHFASIDWAAAGGVSKRLIS